MNYNVEIENMQRAFNDAWEQERRVFDAIKNFYKGGITTTDELVYLKKLVGKVTVVMLGVSSNSQHALDELEKMIDDAYCGPEE